jgi:hypothetical protein
MAYNRLAELAKANEVTLEPELYTNNIGKENTIIARSASKSTSKLSKSTSEHSAATSESIAVTGDDVPTKKGLSPRHVRAYTLWHEHKMSLTDMCAELRTQENPLAMSTVMYVYTSLLA